MNGNEIYDKITWINNIPEVISNNILSREKLKSLSERGKQSLIIKIIQTLSEFFCVIPDYYYDPHDTVSDESEDISGLNSTLLIWLNGLVDLDISQIIGGLLDIINMRTEYKKWPPKSVMEFYSVCKSSRPSAFHEIKNLNDFIKIEDYYKKLDNNHENINELDIKGRRLYDEKSGNKIEYHPEHGKRLFSVSIPMPRDRDWFKALTPELKEKVFKSSTKSWISLKEIMQHDKDLWNFLDVGFERSPWFKPIIEAFREYYKINTFTDLRFISK